MNRKISFKKLFASITISVTITLSLVGCAVTPNNQKVTDTGVYFDTVISITLYGNDKSKYIDECFQLADKYEKYFSNTIASSDISQINANPGTPVEVHSETISLLQEGIKYGELSNGSFDITLGALSDLWDFGNNKGTIPDATLISQAVSTIDYHNISMQGNQVTLLTPGAKIDLGGIAKGYIADQMKAYLNGKGITSGIINLGGNVLSVGPKADQEAYTIGIQKPFSEDGSSIASIEITDESVVTSGTYQRYFKKNDVIYHHILDVTTGYPYENNLASVTIINHSSVDGDGLSTTVFTMGLEAGMEFVENLEDTEAIFITSDGEIYYTSGIGTRIPFTKL